jgi:hypothetical protein
MKASGMQATSTKRHWRLALAILMVVSATPVFAQIVNFTASKNPGNSPDEVSAGAFISYQRTSAVTFASSGLDGTVRYAAGVGADTGLLSNWTEVLNADYSVTFDVTAPGAYDLDITTSISGAFTLVNDGDAAATGSATAVTYSGGVLASGNLGLTSPGSFTSNTGGDVPFLRTNSAQIQGVSNGVPQTHSFRFTWTMQCAGAPGGFSGADECAVRLGLPLTFAGQTAGAYPGVGARVQAQDGHFFTVHYVSLCGDGVVQAAGGEQCDAGANNGLPGSCCSSSCQLLSAGTVCRTDGGFCDVAETCDGASATCPADVKHPNGFVCRTAAGACDAAEACDGIGNDCPADAFEPAGTVCRAGSGDSCDPDEQCTGSSTVCPPDVVSPSGTICRSGSGDLCDPDERCSGTPLDPCPADSVSGAFVVCRPSTNDCDAAESCPGTPAQTCPADAVKPDTAVCRAAAGACDEAENCDGINVACPADAKSTAVCRSAAGACDVAESCDGVGDDCPADGFEPSSTVCRGPAGVCDVAESCSGSSADCPADSVSGAFVTCRPAADVCDVAEHCDGVNSGCPADSFAPATTVCRASSGTCDVAETCTGSSASCPADTGLPDSDGDTVCDVEDNCQTIANPTQDNGDGDSLGDACDPCTNIAPTAQEKAKLTLTKLQAPANDDKLSFASFFTNVPSAPTIDPVANGVRFVIVDSTGDTPVDVTIPGGAYDAATRSGWKANGSGTSWTYKNSGAVVPLANGITKVAIKAITKTPGKYRTQVKGKNGNYPVNPANLPIVPTIVIDPPFASSGQCGEAMFPATPPSKPSCAVVSGGKTVKCK